jgi:large subunit ribosomal protein L7/L12
MGDWRDEPDRFDVILLEHGPRKITVVKVLRDILGLSLVEGRDFIESLPRAVRKDVSKEEARSLQRRLEEAGGSVLLEALPGKGQD